MIIKMRSKLPVSPEVIWNNLKSTSTFQKVAAPLMIFKFASKGGFPNNWKEESYPLKMYLFGLIPLGDHHITFVKIDDANRVLSTDETGQICKVWHHTMRVLVETDARSTVFQDELFFKNGLLTLPTYVGVYLFFMYRHIRIKQLIKKGVI